MSDIYTHQQKSIISGSLIRFLSNFGYLYLFVLKSIDLKNEPLQDKLI